MLTSSAVLNFGRNSVQQLNRGAAFLIYRDIKLCVFPDSTMGASGRVKTKKKKRKVNK